MHRLLLALPFLFAACSGSASPDGTEPDAGTSPRADAAPEGAEIECDIGLKVFEEDRLHRLEVTMADADWQAMITEGEQSPEYGGPKKIYRTAQVRYDDMELSNVALRLKGHYSLLTARGHSFPMKMDFNKITDGQKLDGLKKLNLHPAGELQSTLREHLSYGALREMGLHTARTTFIEVVVNGENLGLYGGVEQIGGRFVRCKHDAPHGDLYKPEEADGSLAYKGNSIDDYPEANHKWPDESSHQSFLHMLDVINHGSLADMGTVLDIPGVLSYLAGNIAVGNFDFYASFGHNYYLYEISPGKFTMLPWDMNFSQQALWDPCGFGRNTSEFPISHRLLGDMAHVQQYKTLLEGMLAGPASESRLHKRLDDALVVLGNKVSAADSQEIRQQITQRVGYLEAGLVELSGICPESTE